MAATWRWTLVTFLAVTALACAASAPSTPASAPGPHPHVAYLVGHGWHVGLAVRRADVPPGRWPESAAFDHRVRYLEVGWGDGGYYPAARATTGLALKAAFSSTSSVLHVAGIDAPLTEFFPESSVIEVPLSQPGFTALLQFIDAAYARDATGNVIVVGPGLYGVSRFYRATGRYSLLRNSNHWTAKALAEAGCPIDPGDIVTAGGLLDHARRFGRLLRPAATEPGPARCR